MTVRENLEVGAYLPPARERMTEGLSAVHALFPILRGKGSLLAATLSGGEQQMLALGGTDGAAQAPFAGRSVHGAGPRTIAGLCDTLRSLSGQGIGLLIAGQHVRRILTLASRAYLLEQGRITEEAHGAELLRSPQLRRALLNTA